MFDVPGRRSPQMRARDADREATRRVLDDALTDGQLSGEEHRQRVTAATTAATLGDLEGLVGDLQSNAPVVPPQRQRRRGLVIAAAVGGVIAVAVAVLVAVDDADPPATPAAPLAESPVPPTGNAEPEPTVVTMPTAFHTVEGMTGLLDTIRQRFGDTTGIELAVWKEGAMLLRPDPSDPASKQLYRFDNGWGTPSGRPRDPEDQPLNLGDFDVPAVVEALRVAPETVRIPAADVSEVVLDIDDVPGATSPALELMVKVSSTSGDSGFIYLDRAGALTRVEYPR